MFSRLIYEDISILRKKFAVMLVEDFIYETDKYKITVKKCFDYDLASVPGIFQGFISKVGIYDAAATIHDWLYSCQAVSRKEADDIFLQAMKEAGVPFLERNIMYLAVRIGGWITYRCSELERKHYFALGKFVRK